MGITQKGRVRGTSLKVGTGAGDSGDWGVTVGPISRAQMQGDRWDDPTYWIFWELDQIRDMA